MKLYYVPMTRSNRPRWFLEELGVPYELQRLDPKKGENKSPEYLAIHPAGKVPSLVDGEVTMFESAAIVAYLADKYIEKKLAPPLGSKDRAAYYQWLFFGMTTLEGPVSKVGYHTSGKPPAERIPAVAEEGRAEFERIAPVLEKALEAKEYLLGQFTAADIVVGGSLLWASGLGLLDSHPKLKAYTQRLKERPAFRRSRAD